MKAWHIKTPNGFKNAAGMWFQTWECSKDDYDRAKNFLLSIFKKDYISFAGNGISVQGFYFIESRKAGE